MEPVGLPAPPDPDFQATVPAPLIELDHSPESYLRLVANPFLGLFGLIVWLGALDWIVVKGGAGPFGLLALVLTLASLGLLPALFQYHCLDCGATGRLSRWRKHICPRSAARRFAGRPRRLRGPTPPVQVVLWLWGLMALTLLAHAFGWDLLAR